eukprot:64636_1
MSLHMQSFLCVLMIELTNSQTISYSQNYIFIDTLSTYDEATWFCESNYATTLASIHSIEDNNELLTLNNGSQFWIGLNDRNKDGSFMWDDNTSLNYTNWDNNQPDNNWNEDCVHYTSNSVWNDKKCYNTFAFACNQPIKYESDGITYWKLLNTLSPITGYKYGKIQLKHKMYLKTVFTFNSKYDDNTWTNMFRIGTYGNETECWHHGSRYPAFFIHGNKLVIGLSNNGSCWSAQIFFYLTNNITYSIEMIYNLYNVSVTVNYSNIINQIIYDGPRFNITNIVADYSILNTFVDVIISDPINPPANIEISELLIISYDDQLSTTGDITFNVSYNHTNDTISPDSIQATLDKSIRNYLSGH